jgi:hypothetical protein
MVNRWSGFVCNRFRGDGGRCGYTCIVIHLLLGRRNVLKRHILRRSGRRLDLRIDSFPFIERLVIGDKRHPRRWRDILGAIAAM